MTAMPYFETSSASIERVKPLRYNSSPASNLRLTQSDTGASATIALHKDVRHLQEIYEVDSSYGEIFRFLSVYADVATILYEAHSTLLAYFADAKLHLLFDVHSRDTSYYEAIISVHTNMNYDEADALMTQFDEDLGFKYFQDSGGHLIITVY